MRKVIRAARQLRPALLYRGNFVNDGSSRRRDLWFDTNSCSVYSLARNVDDCRCKHPSYMNMISRAMSVGVAKVANGVAELNRDGPLTEYGRRIAAGELLDGDASQLGTIEELQRLYDELLAKEGACRLDRYAISQKAGRSMWYLSRFIPQTPHTAVKGLYLYGGVGTGKTMLMDLFFDQLPHNWRKKRIHFHDMMLNVHSHLQKHKCVADPLEIVAGELSNESILLCLDEFMVTDVADALILNRLFRHLFSNGVILVATSNRAPDKLYEGGLQRDLFLPFISTLKERCVVHEIGSCLDYRKMSSAEQGFYFVGKHLSNILVQKFEQLIGEHVAVPKEVEVVMGRKLLVPLGGNGCAYFHFDELCDRPLGAADYFGLFKKFHTLAVEGIPIFGAANKSAAYRFVTLVDVMYENRARLLCSADATPTELFEHVITIADAKQKDDTSSLRSLRRDVSEICVDNELGFAKDRTISRLTEMNSREYLEQHAQMHGICIREYCNII